MGGSDTPNLLSQIFNEYTASGNLLTRHRFYGELLQSKVWILIKKQPSSGEYAEARAGTLGFIPNGKVMLPVFTDENLLQQWMGTEKVSNMQASARSLISLAKACGWDMILINPGPDTFPVEKKALEQLSKGHIPGLGELPSQMKPTEELFEQLLQEEEGTYPDGQPKVQKAVFQCSEPLDPAHLKEIPQSLPAQDELHKIMEKLAESDTMQYRSEFFQIFLDSILLMPYLKSTTFHGHPRQDFLTIKRADGREGLVVFSSEAAYQTWRKDDCLCQHVTGRELLERLIEVPSFVVINPEGPLAAEISQHDLKQLASPGGLQSENYDLKGTAFYRLQEKPNNPNRVELDKALERMSGSLSKENTEIFFQALQKSNLVMPVRQISSQAKSDDLEYLIGYLLNGQNCVLAFSSLDKLKQWSPDALYITVAWDELVRSFKNPAFGIDSLVLDPLQGGGWVVPHGAMIDKIKQVSVLTQGSLSSGDFLVDYLATPPPERIMKGIKKYLASYKNIDYCLLFQVKPEQAPPTVVLGLTFTGHTSLKQIEDLFAAMRRDLGEDLNQIAPKVELIEIPPRMIHLALKYGLVVEDRVGTKSLISIGLFLLLTAFALTGGYLWWKGTQEPPPIQRVIPTETKMKANPLQALPCENPTVQVVGNRIIETC